MANETFMQALARSVAEAVENEPGRTQLRGMNKADIVATVRAITESVDRLPTNTSLHVLLFSITYVRNALITTMQENDKALETQTGGHA